MSQGQPQRTIPVAKAAASPPPVQPQPDPPGGWPAILVTAGFAVIVGAVLASNYVKGPPGTALLVSVAGTAVWALAASVVQMVAGAHYTKLFMVGSAIVLFARAIF